MKNNVASVFLLAVSAIIAGWLIWNWKEFKIFERSYLLFTVTLVIVTAFYAWQTQKMVGEMQKTNQLNFRPYLFVRGRSPSSLARLAIDAAAKEEIGKIYTSQEDILSLARSEDGMIYLVYSIENIGNVPARNVQNQIDLYESNKSNGNTTQIPVIRHDPSDLIFPKKSIDRIIPLGKDITYRKTTDDIELDITIRVNYEDGDGNKYFTIRRLSHKVVERLDESQLQTIFQDEGIEK